MRVASNIYIYIYIYWKQWKTKVFFAFALRVSPLLRLFRHSKVFLLTYYVTDVIVITIIMALVIRSTREQLAWFQIIKNGFIFQNKKPLFVFSHALGGAECGPCTIRNSSVAIKRWLLVKPELLWSYIYIRCTRVRWVCLMCAIRRLWLLLWISRILSFNNFLLPDQWTSRNEKLYDVILFQSTNTHELSSIFSASVGVHKAIFKTRNAESENGNRESLKVGILKMGNI